MGDLYKKNGKIWVKKPEGLVVSNTSGKNYTDNNVPLHAGKVMYICKSQLPIWQKKYNEDPDIFKDMNIAKVYVIPNEEYMTFIRNRSENSATNYEILEDGLFEEKYGFKRQDLMQTINN